jgi:hypothetical protein
MPDAWSASELNLVLTLPSMALAGASPALEFVLALATQPVSGNAASAAGADGRAVTAWAATGASPDEAARTAAMHAKKRTLVMSCHIPS